MKKIISILGALLLVGVVAFAQPQHKKGNKNDGEQWREKVRAEQVAFLTNELNLTESEAQSFWPVYNDVQNQRREAFKASAEAFKALQEGIDGKDVSKLLDKYLDAQKACQKIDADAVARYKKVLPVEKVAKLMMAEEKFRHQQIGKLGQGGGNRPGGPRPGKDMPVERPVQPKAEATL